MSHFGTGFKNRCSGNLQRQSRKLVCYKTYWEELRFLPLQSHFWVFLLAEARAWRQLYRACGVNTWCDPGSIWTRCLFRLNSSSPFTEEYSWLALTMDCCKLTVDWDVGVKEDILKIFYKELKKMRCWIVMRYVRKYTEIKLPLSTVTDSGGDSGGNKLQTQHWNLLISWYSSQLLIYTFSCYVCVHLVNVRS